MTNTTCKRPKCTRQANRQGLCHQHYEREPMRGYVDAQPTRERIQLLLDRGMGWRGIEDATGLSVGWLKKHAGRVQARTQHRVFSIPVPRRVVAGGEVDAWPTRRRIQALAAIGWPQYVISEKCGWQPKYANYLLGRDVVLSSTAARVDAVYRSLCMTPGPSEAAVRIAKRHGWIPPLGWDDIDDPNERPVLHTDEKVSFADKFLELREFGLGMEAIAERMGISVTSVERQMYRHGLGRTA